MIRVILSFLLFVGAFAGILYGVPEFKTFRVRHKRKIILALALSILALGFIYFSEIVVNG